MKIFGKQLFQKKAPPPSTLGINGIPGFLEAVDRVVASSDLNPFSGTVTANSANWQHSYFNGDKFYNGFGETQVHHVDYWTLRQRSEQLFNENLYARGLIRRLVTNEINTGLAPEAVPDERILGVPEGSLGDWSELVESRFLIWGKNPQVCDWGRSLTFGALQRAARAEALISGDVLVVLRQSKRTKLPAVQLIKGAAVQSPLADEAKVAEGHEIKHGIELDPKGRTVAHWVRKKDGSYFRLPVFGAKSGRKISWMVYGTDKRLDDVRGQPLLSLVLQSLKEIDRYRDAVQRKAVINSILAMFITKTQDKPSSLPLTGGATRRETVGVTDSDGTKRNLDFSRFGGGLVLQELNQGEKPESFGGEGTDLNFGVFEEAVIQGVAWANEIPPEILRMSFSNNYSASQAAINEFRVYLNLRWADWGENFCAPIYLEWLVSETLLNKIKAPGLVEAWRNSLSQYDVFGAWINTEWYGSIKPSTDMFKQGKSSELLVKNGWSTRARESRILTGTKYKSNAERLKRENEQLAECWEPLSRFMETSKSSAIAPQAPEKVAEAIVNHMQLMT